MKDYSRLVTLASLVLLFVALYAFMPRVPLIDPGVIWPILENAWPWLLFALIFFGFRGRCGCRRMACGKR